MNRESFDQLLRNVQDEVLVLGGMVEEALVEAVRMLKKRDMAGSRRLMAEDRHINERRFVIEGEALTLVATQAPVASDARILAGVLELATELERIGDYAKGIAKINLMIGEGPLIESLETHTRMAEKAQSMLHRALEAFIRRDVATAQALTEEDDEVDALYNQAYRDLMNLVLVDTRNIDQATLLLWAAHNLERSADRVINICERTIFVATGRRVELDQESESPERDLPPGEED